MSSKLKPILRKVTITNAVWATGDWTLTTSAAHLLGVGDVFKFTDQNFPEEVTATCIAGTTGSTLKFTNANSKFKFPEYIMVSNYGTGATGAQDTFSFEFLDNPNGLIHVVSNGTATCTVKAQGSLDNVHWIDIGTATAVTAGSQFEIPVTKPYAYGRLNFTVATASAGGGANNIKAYRCGC